MPNLATGTISIQGYPATAQTISFNVTVADGAGALLNQTWNIVVPFVSGPVAKLVVATGLINGSSVSSVVAGTVLPFYVMAEDAGGNLVNNPATPTASRSR